MYTITGEATKDRKNLDQFRDTKNTCVRKQHGRRRCRKENASSQSVPAAKKKIEEEKDSVKKKTTIKKKTTKR
jgi:hypothetical protein